MSASQITVAKYLAQLFALCGRSQREIAIEVGYPNPNVLTMFKQGKTKVPYGVIGRLAKATDSDPAYFLRLALLEYEPALLQTIELILAEGTIVTADERELLDLAREASDGCRVSLDSSLSRLVVSAALRAVAQSGQLQADAAVSALNRLPRNGRHLR